MRSSWFPSLLRCEVAPHPFAGDRIVVNRSLKSGSVLLGHMKADKPCNHDCDKQRAHNALKSGDHPDKRVGGCYVSVPGGRQGGVAEVEDVAERLGPRRASPRDSRGGSRGSWAGG